MATTESSTQVNAQQLLQHAERIRGSGALGRSELLLRLFNFFVECAVTQRVPKEIEVALDVFGKKVDFDVAQDAVVRVYIYKLRRKLDEYYAGPGIDETARLVMPRGEYRLELQERQPAEVSVITEVEPEDEDPVLTSEAEVELESLVANAAASQPPRWRSWLITTAILLAVNLGVLLLIMLRPSSQDSAALRAVRSNPIWAGMLDDNLPIYIAVGDYYIFGELDESSMEVQRLVREFNINSPTDLETHLKNNPDQVGRYMDMSLQYLPTSTAFALRNLMPILEPNNKSARQVQVILASDLTPAMARSAHIVYVGLISGMSFLRQLVFDGSRFAIGNSYDELVDLQTKKRYISQAGEIADARATYTDYAYFSARTGVDGNEIVILAGARDVGLLHVAEVATQNTSLAELNAQAGISNDFEALYSVQALQRSNLGGRLLLTHKFATRRMAAEESEPKPIKQQSSSGASQ
ncbi:MAG: hypothetical protein QM808_15005 [Steroidobacteraceae bacterium]